MTNKIYPSIQEAITAKKVVKLIFSNLAVIEVTPEGLLLREVAAGVTPKEVQAKTEATLLVGKHVKEIEL
jgi:acyl CoA:acetate/3-ketoacid CoA transferase beta subunit